MELPYKAKLIFLQLGRIGDFMLSTAMLPVIRRERPDVNIGIIVKKKLIPIVDSCKHIDTIYTYHISPENIISYLRFLSFKADVFVDLNHFVSRTSRVVSFLSFSQRRLTISTGHRLWSFTDSIYKGNVDKLHIIDRALTVARFFRLNVPASDRKPHLCIPDYAFNCANMFLDEIGFDKFITINISSGSEDRLLSAEKWLDIIDYISDISDMKILILALPEHREIVNKILTGANKIGIKAHTDGDFFIFSALITRASLLISPDTSAVHIASAYDVPVIGLYPDVKWNMLLFSPISKKSVMLYERDCLVRDMHTLKIKEAVRKFIT